MYLIFARSDIKTESPGNEIIVKTKCLVPGDIYYYSTDKGYHVGIVGFVPSNPDDRFLGNIRLTESTWHKVDLIDQGRVMVHETLFNYTKTKPWIVGRIMK